MKKITGRESQVFTDNKKYLRKRFIQYTKELASMRARLSMSKYAQIVPPNQRIMSRFMNLMPLFG
jgi:hypothetical protein